MAQRIGALEKQFAEHGKGFGGVFSGVFVDQRVFTGLQPSL